MKNQKLIRQGAYEEASPPKKKDTKGVGKKATDVSGPKEVMPELKKT